MSDRLLRAVQELLDVLAGIRKPADLTGADLDLLRVLAREVNAVLRLAGAP